LVINNLFLKGNNMTDKELDALGASLARQCGWDGAVIFKVLCEALTDANHHTLRVRLEDAFNHYMEETT
jgi:hypothetical protein